MDKKDPVHAWPPRPPQPAPRAGPWRRARVAALLVAIAVLASLTDVRRFLGSRLRGIEDGPTLGNGTVYDPMDPWNSITPSTDLVWHRCYTDVHPNFRCARLTVPMDWTRPAAAQPAKVHIALTLLLPSHPAAPSDNASSSAHGRTANPPPPPPQPQPPVPSKQPLLINPGGPGGSGVALALMMAPALQKVLGPDQPILGFDPRGVGFTTPRADCWAVPVPPGEGCAGAARGGWAGGEGDCDGGEDDDEAAGLLHRMQWNGMITVFGSMNESEATLRYMEAGQRGVNGLCRARDARLGQGSVLRFAATRFVARDMVAILDAWEEWVEREGGIGAVVRADQELKGKLVYWGFSVMLDGVVDAEFYETPVWKESLVDADKVLGEFFRFCAEAGTRCALYREGDAAADVQRRFEDLLERLKTKPVTFIHPTHSYPILLRSYLVRSIVFRILYTPMQGFPALASLLNFIYEQQYEVLAGASPDAEQLCSLTADPRLLRDLTDAQRAVMCSDKTFPVNATVADIREAFEAMAETSQFADIWIGLMMQCNGWDISTHSDNKPWPSSAAAAGKEKIETAFPLLFLSNTYDPVTPLRAAVKMALKFKGAGLLELQSLGHCTISSVSRCVVRKVREYVHAGKVPPPPTVRDGQLLTGDWTRCVADEVPWGAGNGTHAEGVVAETAEDREMVEGWREVQRVMGKMNRWGVGEQRELDMDAVMALAKQG
ncbi:uncharacterized protein THITE_2110995 [Thermothielavioides terrestris NRRL 8126]|uniref:Peptidase S33 tripeptidyl aminopeptidase-like C-terminal domain-containing protein n=1 Tax=Thermothielavioides terrestris (strain ATCC 38088 / NRRL 8126) TaxID=578455 RepID=G2QVX0_THETT|nr:uncharacterized protein THITE_2110995 [Thermothielavioides terrestris NRRL 8126]AEO64702.1 hypothetical protein THITE_2110995 [Thermothielavioides terrestris NRRL 8126]